MSSSGHMIKDSGNSSRTVAETKAAAAVARALAMIVAMWNSREWQGQTKQGAKIAKEMIYSKRENVRGQRAKAEDKKKGL